MNEKIYSKALFGFQGCNEGFPINVNYLLWEGILAVGS